ncbi:MAG: hypothetical protein U9Q04_04900 [Campylobacterota bacterium]|nr:hypothetical protein [Campylobacterota bacterium]
MKKAYFHKVKKGRKVYGLVFGQGKVIDVFEDGHYKFIVRFKNDDEVPYTEEGIPGWGNFKEQTLFYKKDIDLSSYDFSATTKILSVKKIIKLKDKKKLEIRLPSGVWCDCSKCVKDYIELMLEKENYHLFRKKRD